ncbi:MAG: winged helix-turn-helix domain-containing protein [Acidobacteriia bacterium]|nr:winged helix-turn-helix domain-containing protein [Terriglobia bacterium]
MQAAELRRNGAKVKLEGQPLTVLALLVGRPGEVVSREELKQKLWPADTFVDFEHSINFAVNRLREALQDSATTPRYVETLPRRGYRFIYPLNGSAAASPPMPTGVPRRRWVAMVIGLFVILFAAAIASVPILRERMLDRPAPGAIKNIAVLPFRAQSSDAEQAYLAEGFTEMIITELGTLGSPGVQSHQSVLQYARSEKSATEIAKELKVDCIIEGTVLRVGNRVRVTYNVIIFNPERHLSAGPIERDLGDVLTVQREVSKAVAQQIRVQIPADRLQRPNPRPLSPQGADAIVWGFAYYKRGTDRDRAKAAEWFAKAVESDPDCAVGYAYLALLNSHGGAGRQGGAPANRAAARQWAEKALQMDARIAEAHTALGWLELSDWNFPVAEREFKRAIELNPSFTIARTWYAQLLAAEGRAEDAAAQVAVVLQLDPVSANNVTHAAWSLSAVGKVDEAITHLRAVIDLDPSYAWAHAFLAEAYVRKGMYRESIVEFQSAANLQPDAPPSGLLAYAYAKSGHRAEAQKIVRDLDARLLKARAQDRWIPSNIIVPAYLSVGQKDRALQYLEAAYERRAGGRAAGLAFLKAEECYHPLSSEPRFQDLVRRVGLPTPEPGQSTSHSR